MGQVAVERRASHCDPSGVTVEILDYRWDADAHVVRAEPAIIVLWRLQPTKVKMTGALAMHGDVPLGRLMIYDPHQPHIFNANRVPGSAHLLECQFSGQWLVQRLGRDARLLLDGLGSCLDLRNENIDHLMRRIAQEMRTPRDDTAAILDATVHLLGLELARHASQRAVGCAKREGDPRVKNIVAAIAASEEMPTIAALANRFDISTSHLRRLFHLHSDRTLHEILEEERIKRALQLLDQPDVRLKTIAHRLGYKQPGSFSQAFRAAQGVTPTDYRRRSLTMPLLRDARAH
jgi:AraC-like DNA-binding protein